MSRTRAALLGYLSSQIFLIIAVLLTVVTTPLLLKFLNKEEYGLSTMLLQIVGYLAMFDFGLSNAVSRYLSMHRGEDEHSRREVNRVMSTGFFAFLVIGALICISGISLTPSIVKVFKMEQQLRPVAESIIITLSCFVAIQFPLKIFSGIFYAHQRQLLSNTTGFIIGLLNLALPVILLYFGYGLWAFAYTYIATSAISIVITAFLIRKYYPYLRVNTRFFDWKLLRELFGYGFFVFLNALAVQIVFYTDRFMTGAIVSLSVVAMYSITARIPEICRDLIFRIADNAFPAMVEISTKEGRDKFRQIHQKIMLVTVSLISISFWMILMLDYWFIKLWVGESFYAGFSVLLLSLFLMLQHGILHVSAVCLGGAGVVKGTSIMSLVEAGLNICLTLWLGHLKGIEGILLATILSNILTSGWFVILRTMQFMNMSLKEYMLKTILIPFLLISGIGCLFFIFCQWLFQHWQMNWINLICIGLLFFAGFAWLAWKQLLKDEFVEYVPHRLKKYLEFI